jgi:hypothetical protein
MKRITLHETGPKGEWDLTFSREIGPPDGYSPVLTIEQYAEMGTIPIYLSQPDAKRVQDILAKFIIDAL